MPRASAWVPVLLGLMVACDTSPALSGSEGDGVSAVQFDDLPVPDQIRLLDRHHESDSVVIGRYRYGNFVYSGTIAVPAVSSYLRERMPQHAWRLTEHKVDTKGEEYLRFCKGIYTTECSLRKVESSTRMEVSLRTSLAQESK